MYLAVFIASFGGGAIRGLVGFTKYQLSYKNVEFRLSYFLGMMLISGVIGLLTGMAVYESGIDLSIPFSPALAFIVGYAGGDFIENLYKIIFKKKTLF